MRTKQEQEMDLVKKKAAEEMQKCRREESQGPLSMAEQEEREVPEDNSLQPQTSTEEADPAGSPGCTPIQRKEPHSLSPHPAPSLFSWNDAC